MLRRIWAVMLKEIRHILRDRITLVLVALAPTFLLFLLAYALTTDIHHVPVAILDMDRSPTSRAFIQQMLLGDDLDLYAQVLTMDELEDLLLDGEVKAALVLHPAFEHDLLSLRGLALQIVVDGTEPQSGGFVVEHIGRRVEDFAAQLLSAQLKARGVSLESLQPIDLRIRTWYNPNMKSKVDLVPGLISMVLGLPGLSVALTLAREHEHGTMEQIMVTPVGRAELLLGKMTPYVITGLANVILSTIIALVWFRVPFRGSFGLFFSLSVIFLFAILSVGIVLGVFIRTQAASLALSFLVIFFPGFFLTGIFFPLASMPSIVRLESYSLPGTHYAHITRASFITGAGLDVLWPYGAALMGMGIVLTAIAAFSFRKKLR
ncbi:MAG: ABC transporter permease [Chloroflexota bacterium]